MSNKIDYIVEGFQKNMIKNFEKEGYLVPIFFRYYLDNRLLIAQIPVEFLLTPEGKNAFQEKIQEFCTDPTLLMVGMIVEADVKIIPIKDNKNVDLNNIDFSDLKFDELETKDTIILYTSTPQKTNVIVYHVDVDNKKVLEEITEQGEIKQVFGLFSDLFYWSKN